MKPKIGDLFVVMEMADGESGWGHWVGAGSLVELIKFEEGTFKQKFPKYAENREDMFNREGWCIPPEELYKIGEL